MEFFVAQKNLSRTRRRHQTKVQAPSPICTPHGYHPPPRGALLQTIDAFHALPPSDIRQPRRAPAPLITRIQQSLVIIFGPSPDLLDLVTRNRLLEELIDRPKYVSRRDLVTVLPNPDRWPHVLCPKPSVAHDHNLVRFGEHRGRIGRKGLVHVHEHVLARDTLCSRWRLRDVPHDVWSFRVGGIRRKPWREVERKGAHGRRPRVNRSPKRQRA
jgi:hypothetical protein